MVHVVADASTPGVHLDICRNRRRRTGSVAGLPPGEGNWDGPPGSRSRDRNGRETFIELDSVRHSIRPSQVPLGMRTQGWYRLDHATATWEGEGGRGSQPGLAGLSVRQP